MKTIIAIVLFLGWSLVSKAEPFSNTISLPSDFMGGMQQRANKIQYHATYTSSFGGEWNVAGTAVYTQSQIKENFSGTISDTSINGTFTQVNGTLSWVSDSYTILDRYDDPKVALSFKLVIKNGVVTGSATYTPE